MKRKKRSQGRFVLCGEIPEAMEPAWSRLQEQGATTLDLDFML